MNRIRSICILGKGNRSSIGSILSICLCSLNVEITDHSLKRFIGEGIAVQRALVAVLCSIQCDFPGSRNIIIACTALFYIKQA